MSLQDVWGKRPRDVAVALAALTLVAALNVVALVDWIAS